MPHPDERLVPDPDERLVPGNEGTASPQQPRPGWPVHDHEGFLALLRH